MNSLRIILCLTICMGYRALLAEAEPFRLQLNGQDKVSLDLAPLVSAFYQEREVSRNQWEAAKSIVNQRPQNEVFNPPVEIASKLSRIETEMSRKQAEEILGGDWFEIGGEYWNSGYLAEYMNRTFPNLMIQVWYGWTERRVAEGRLIRKTGPNAPILAPPASLKTKLPLPDAQ
jgi:hypothetical protein